MSKSKNQAIKNNKTKKDSMAWQQVLFAGFAILIVVSMVISAFM